jgi:type I restriction-modification system DNA methylase subunit
MANHKKYTELDARTELEQQAATDLSSALGKRGAKVKHHGTGATHAPSTAPADITVDWGTGAKATRLLVEVAQRADESEFTAITEHLNRAVASAGGKVIHCLYSGRSTSVRLAKFIRNENQRRAANGEAGRIIFLRLNDLQEILLHWASYPKNAYPVNALLNAVSRWTEFSSDALAYMVLQSEIFPDWTEKEQELDAEIQKGIALKQERLRRDIVRLENKLRESGITGSFSHKTLIFLFFAALYEDKRGSASRMTLNGFCSYKDNMSAKDKREFSDRTVHHLLTQHIAEDLEIAESGLMRHYEKIDLSDSFIIQEVIPIFESYPLSEGGMDFIGAVFEALARRAEKDNRIGQFFTPETAVASACRFAAPKPTDIVLDPACGTGRFLIHSMGVMLAQAGQVPAQTRDTIEIAIKQKQLLGADIDPWVATIAKMNMYLHGDGKSNIRSLNGLALSTGTPFAPREPAHIDGTVDIVLTNPPLGDVNFQDIAQRLAADGVFGEPSEPPGTTAYRQALQKSANDWTNLRLSVVPHICLEEKRRETLEKRIQKWNTKVRECIMDLDEKGERTALRYLNDAQSALADVIHLIGTGNVSYEPSGNTAKGGALFLSAILDYLKPVRLPQAQEEWKGGMVSIVIDEAILNSRDYKAAREFIIANFFVKVVVSLPRDAFQFLARTTAKTSVLLLARKPDPAVIQREPVFYAKARVIGYTSSGITDQNDLPAINLIFDEWREDIQQCYKDSISDEDLLDKLSNRLCQKNEHIFFYRIDPRNPAERLDFSYRRMRDIVSRLESPVKLGDLVENVIRIPDEKDIHKYAYVSSADGRVRSKGEQDLAYAEKDLREIKPGDILLSGIDVVKGAIGVVGADCDGLVVSKEFFTLRPKHNATKQVLPEYMVCLLRSPKMREIIEGTVTGVSNRTRIEDIIRFLELPLPVPADMLEQQKIVSRLLDAYKAQDQAHNALAEIEASVAEMGQVHC